MSLPVQFIREDTRAKAQFRKWITNHIGSWFNLTEKHGLEIKMEDIVLVTGCHRTRSWSNIAFQDEAEVNKKLSFGFSITTLGGASIHWESSNKNVSGALHNHGPSGKVCATDYEGHQVLNKLRRVPSGLT